RVPRPDLHKGLRRTGFIPLRGGHELVGAANAPLRPGHELYESDATLACPRAQHHRRVERRQDRQRVARRRAGAQIPADRACVADLRRADGPRGFAQSKRARVLVEHPRIGDERSTALADALAVMSRAPTDLVAVLETVLDRAANMCDAERASIHLLEADGYHTAAFWGPTSEEYKRLAYDTVRTPGRDTLIGRV